MTIFDIHSLLATFLQAVKKKDKLISELRSELTEMENKVGEANGRHKKAEEQLEELRQELRDMESLLQTNQDEMTALHEQLTKVSVFSLAYIKYVGPTSLQYRIFL